MTSDEASKNKYLESDEIDLVALFHLFWKKKLAIALVMLVSLSGGMGYAFLAPQEWSATAEITLPDYPSQTGLQKVVNALVVISPEFSHSDFYKDNPVVYRDLPFDRYGVYNSFVTSFGSKEVLDSFFIAHPEFKGAIFLEKKSKNPSDQDVSVILKATSLSGESAKKLLDSYIDFYLVRYKERKRAELYSAINAVIDTLDLKSNILNSEVERSLIQKKISMVKSIDVSSVNIVPFSYQQKVMPSATMDKPKRTIVIALSIVLGLMLGVGFVMLRNAWETGLGRK